MPSATFDTVDGAEVGLDKNAFRGVRTGWINGLSTGGTSQDILASALSALPPYGSAYSATYPLSRLERHVVTPLGRGNNKARFSLFYETPPFAKNGGSSILFTLERKRSLVRVETQLHPAEKKPILITWQNPADGKKKTPAVASLAYMTPLHSIVATGYIIGNPPAGYEDLFGKVNSETWQGKPKGYWLYVGADDVTRDYGNSYEIRLEFLSKWTEDWSSWALFRDPATGLFLPVRETNSKALKDEGYKYAISTRNGITKAGLYDLGGFAGTFGF